MAEELSLDWNLVGGDDPAGWPSDDGAADALVASLRTYACVDMAFIAARMGTTEQEAARILGDAVYLDPATARWQSSDEYLSGNLREKLEVAKVAAKSDNRFLRNVAALAQAMPARVPFDAIYMNLGSPWMPEDLVWRFAAHLMGVKNIAYFSCVVVHDPTTGTWDIRNKTRYRNSAASAHVWGTRRISALSIMEHTLNGTPIRVTDEVRDPHTKSGVRRVLNHEETLMAIEKERAMQEEFVRWVRAVPERRALIEELYNVRYCGYRRRHYDGSILEFPGMSEGIELRPHQRNAAMRILLESDVLLAHDVGAGKTYTSIAAIMELRRMGISKKNLVVVPNNVMGQWSNLFREMYPAADLLVIAPKDFVPAKRQAVLREIRDGDHDAVIMCYSSFRLIGISREDRLRSLDASIRELDEIIRDPNRCTGAVKRRRKSLVNKRLKIKSEERLASADITFDELGVTRLFVDEAQNFKNLTFNTSHKFLGGIGNGNSSTCQHMYDAIRSVQRAGGGAVFLSGTIVTNSITDLFVLQTYLQHGTLKLLELESFDAWANMFARKVTGFEIDVDTSTFRYRTRLAGFGNLGELASILSNVADFHRLDANDGLPSCDSRQDVLIPKTKVLAAYLKHISQRAELVRSGRARRKDDNLLKICVDGRMAAIDIRLVYEHAHGTGPDSKVATCARNVYDIWRDGAAQRLTQVVFCDVSTPKETFNVYDELKNLLVRMGVPEAEVAFVHDAKTERERTRLFDAVRSGKVRVLVGSTFKLGIGVNIQDRLVAAHHLDVPWRPADMIQREGRILRQGNINPRVKIFRYVTEGSFDAYSWQLIENKQRVIDELLAGTYEGRFLESDVGKAALSYAEIKALAVNNPLLKERVEVSSELERNIILQRRTASVRKAMQAQIAETTRSIETLEDERDRCLQDVDFLNRNGDVGMDAETREHVRTLIALTVSRNAFQPRKTLLKGYYRGFSIVLPDRMDPERPYILLKGHATHMVDLRDAKPIGIPIRMDNALAKIGERVTRIEERIDSLYRDWETMEAELASKASDRTREIAKCRDRLARIDLELEERNAQ